MIAETDTLAFADRTETRARLNASASRYYVYLLGTPDGQPFYVGKGCGDRVFQHEAEARGTLRRSHKLNLIRKILRTGGELRYALAAFFDDESDAHRLERGLIRRIGRHDLGTGPLTNQTDGGEGTANPSEESRQRRLASLGGEADDPDRRVVNAFFAEIGGPQPSVPIKPVAWKKFEPLYPSIKTINPQERMAKAIVASAAANGIMLVPGTPIPRRLTIRGGEYLIENGCGREMIKAGLVGPPKPGAHPRDETMPLTRLGLSYIRRSFGEPRLVELGVLDP
ncbi:GIY-YIG nuclease family protein [Azospirillum sp. TSO5]|uniref:GIY-YIG nuclease family protein n=1 Tax=Azospirillum sp. TSO5 TaxID=716760 RepID=UPI000D611C3B|nr:GIY-YIG nuclease family protein [Azospirillum sp. TSO5]PWC92653.1 hypothetical protein TSO5_17175 [Azospirillum sp. TSO5]